ncbi:hypothetical protein [[Mycobacterium] nativiensis]|uniref:Uncharacterized protein n=1 Tax=[Mycobacterium] nativiensis TaxID=2855503 RepID=A0ABU5XQB0_9MYCO|nr:hypothetical protein [Mycolicibacter sp. MYC340]MEB3030103.1 hypothetical protein [Mycolicibacter sp. MYC340]
MLLPVDLTAEQVIDRINTQIRLNAADAGDFVQRTRIDSLEHHSDGWCRWLAAYLPGPPGTFPTAITETQQHRDQLSDRTAPLKT